MRSEWDVATGLLDYVLFVCFDFCFLFFNFGVIKPLKNLIIFFKFILNIQISLRRCSD